MKDNVAGIMLGLGILGAIAFADSIHSSFGTFLLTEGVSIGLIFLAGRISRERDDA